ncbi:carbon-nitrogen hydrolase family protein [Archaeoglobus neptunius]|uniref:carbon-nitrogen hydrolase family protein n=1 Tax=Archaeoglobus neptunius TaxID=2798580 RepID=UPI001928989B|nr:carbon-nitrogen hydrolase family protein [Archaeoglobus neptunius]
MRLALYQMADRADVAANIRAACKAVETINADFICFPEYFTIPADYKHRGKTVEDAWSEVSIPTLEALTRASVEFEGYVIAGTVVERDGGDYFNTCFVLRRGRIVAKYRKMNPIKEELEMGIKPGNNVISIKTEFGRFGILICADCLNQDTVMRVAGSNDIVFLPISLTDPSHPKVEGHPISERIAKEYDVIVAKVSRVAMNVGVKSVVMSPRGVVREAESCCKEEVLVVDVR